MRVCDACEGEGLVEVYRCSREGCIPPNECCHGCTVTQRCTACSGFGEVADADDDEDDVNEDSEP